MTRDQLQRKAAETFGTASVLATKLHAHLTRQKEFSPAVARKLKRLGPIVKEFNRLYGIDENDASFFVLDQEELTDGEIRSIVADELRKEVRQALNRLTGRVD